MLTNSTHRPVSLSLNGKHLAYLNKVRKAYGLSGRSAALHFILNEHAQLTAARPAAPETAALQRPAQEQPGAPSASGAPFSPEAGAVTSPAAPALGGDSQ